MKKIMGNLTGKLSLSILTLVVLLVGVLAGLNKVTTTKAAGIHASQQDMAAMKTAISKLPLVFEPNRGQTDSRVKYIARSSGYNVFLTSPSSAVMAFRTSADRKDTARVTMNLAGANAAAKDQPQDASGTSSYYVGNDRSKWIKGIPTYAKLRYNDIYPGIDVVYQGDNNRFRYDFEVRPGADPKSIRLSYDGANGLRLNEKGEVVVALNGGELIGSKPYIYQEYGGKKHVVDGGYVLTAKNDVRFELGRYDTTKPLVIDPSTTSSLYFGGSTGNTLITGVAADANGIYYTGWTNSVAFDGTLVAGTEDAVVGRADVALHAINNAFFGGSANDEGRAIAVQGTNLVVVGWTSSGVNFPTTGAGLTQPLVLKRAGEIDFDRHAFVAVFSRGGTPGLGVASVLAGTGSEQANAVAIDSTGKIHIAGSTSSQDFLDNIFGPDGPAHQALVATSAQPAFGSQNGTNAFYVAMPATLKSVSYGSFLGGWNRDEGNAVAVDSLGNAYITGSATSWGLGPFGLKPFPVQPPQPCATAGVTATAGPVGCLPQTNPTPQLPIRTFTNGTHAYVAAFNPNAANTPTNSTLLYSLPVGGDLIPSGEGAADIETDIGTAIAVDLNFNVYVGGNTTRASLGSNTQTVTGTPGTNGSLNNVVFTAPGVGTRGLSAAGPGVVADVTITNAGVNYQIGQAVTFSNPELLSVGGHAAVGQVAAVNNSGGPGIGGVTGILITDQGSGYLRPPTVSFCCGAGASGTVTVGVVLLGNATVNGTDGWVIGIGTPGNLTSSFNGGYLSVSGTTLVPLSAPFPALTFGTLVNGDETNGNGATDTAGGLHPSPAGGTNQVTGLVTDSGTPPTVVGSAGPLQNIYVSGASNLAAGGSLAGTDVVLFRRRINSNGFEAANASLRSDATRSPFSKIFTTPNVANQNGVIRPLGDIDLGVASTTAPLSVAITGLNSITGTGPITVRLNTANQVTAVPVNSVITIANVAVDPLANVLNGSATVFDALNNVYLITLSTSSIPGPTLVLGQPITVANVIAGVPNVYNGTFAVAGATANSVSYLVTSATAPGVVSPGSGTITVNLFNGSVTVTASTTTSLSYTVPGNPGVFAATQPTGAGAPVASGLPARGAGTTPLGVATGVAFDPQFSRACIGAFIGAGVNGGLFPNLTTAPTYPGGAQDGLLACADFRADTTLNGPGGGPAGTNGTTVNFSMQAGARQISAAPFTPLSALSLANQVTLSVTNPTGVVQPPIITATLYTPGLAGAPGTTTGPPSATAAANQWLHVNQTADGAGIVVSLLDQQAVGQNNPQFVNDASRLDPGFYQATFGVMPTSGDNNGVVILVTVNLVVTGNIFTNTAIGGGIPANSNPPNDPNPCPVSACVSLNAGGGFTDVGFAPKYIRIPIVSSVPLLSFSNADIVFDLQRDAFGTPVYINSNSTGAPPTLYPVLGPPSLIGGVSSINITDRGSNYPPNTSGNALIFSSPCYPAPGTCTVGTTATGTFNVGLDGQVSTYIITNPGSGYTNPPLVTFPLPIAGGTQAQATAFLGVAPGDKRAGGFVHFSLTNPTPGQVACNATPFAGAAAPLALANNQACYIEVVLPPDMLQGAPLGTYTGKFTLRIPNGTLNQPSLAPESNPPSPSQVVGFSAAGSTTASSSALVTVSINAQVGGGGLILQSPWLSGRPCAFNDPYLDQRFCPPNAPPEGYGPFIGSPPTTPAHLPLAPFAVSAGFNGTVSSNNNNVPYIPGVTGNNPNLAIHTLTLDSRNLNLTSPGRYLATVKDGIKDLRNGDNINNYEIGLTEAVIVPIISPIALPLPTCTIDTRPIPANVLQVATSGILPSSQSPVTTTEVRIDIVNPSSLAQGFYASTVTYAATDGQGNHILDGNGLPVEVSIPVCLSVGNNLKYEYFALNGGSVIASGPAVDPGKLFMLAGTQQDVIATIFAMGPSQNPSLPVPGGPQFAPPDQNLEVPALLNFPLAGTPSWMFLPTTPAGAGDQFGLINGGTCHSTMPVNTCTPAYREITVAPPQNTPANQYAGGVSVAANGTGLLSALPNPMAATLPVWVSSGPSLAYTPAPSVFPNPSAGSVFEIDITNPGRLYNAPPNIMFAGGCVTEPTAVATLNNDGSLRQILITSVGSGCTYAPNITIAPPTVAGGIQATAVAQITDATVNISFTEIAGQTVTSPNHQTITVLPSTFGVNVSMGTLGVINAPNNVFWLATSDINFNNCAPVTFNPTQSQPGFFNGCAISVTPDFSFFPQPLPVGTYYAWFTVESSWNTNTENPPVAANPGAPFATPHRVMVLAKLMVVNALPPQCSLAITDANGLSTGSLPNTGTSIGGYWPSTPINLTVTPSPASTCPVWTASATSPEGFVQVITGTSGAGVGTVSYNAFANTHLTARSGSITVTAGTATATYTVNEAAATDSQLMREVRALYARSLGREPDTGGFNFWTCLNPQPPVPCANLGIPGLGQMVDNFLLSDEGKNTDFQVLAIYKAILNRAPTFAEWSNAVLPFRLNDNPNGWIAAATNLVNTLINSNEYANNFGTVTNIPMVVSTIYQNALGRQPSSPLTTPAGTELPDGIATVVGGGTGGVYALLFKVWGTSPPTFNPTAPPIQIFTKAEFQATTNPLFIQMLYFAILGRDYAPADQAGFDFWLTVANTGGTGIYFNSTATRQLIEGPGIPGVGFVGSPEFQDMFNN